MSDNPFNPFEGPQPSNIPLRPLTGGMVTNKPPQMMEGGEFLNLTNVIVNERGIYRRPGFRSQSISTETLPTLSEDIIDAVVFQRNGTFQTLIITPTSLYRFTNGGFVLISSGCFNIGKYNHIDYVDVPTVNGNTILFFDGANYAQVYDGTTLSNFDTTYSAPGCGAYYENRLWMGNTDSDHPNRLVYSGFDNPSSLDITNYIDFQKETSKILRIESLGPLIIVYFPKAIYYGRPTNNIIFPVAWTKMDFGSVGLVGPKALAQWNDGHYFVGPDDLYYLSASGSLQKFGAPVVKEMIKDCRFKEKIYASVDVENDSIVFGIPGSSQRIETLWYYNYRSEAFSRAEISATMVAALGTFVENTWDGSGGNFVVNGQIVPTWDDFGDAGITSWEDFGSALSATDLYLASEGELLRSSEGSINDFGGEPIPIVIESGDLDFGGPDQVKSVNRMTMKIDRPAESEIRFEVFTSNLRGNNYREAVDYMGTLTIPAGKDEGKINFRATGSTFRFKITSSTEILPYTIHEIVLRVKPRGLQK